MTMDDDSRAALETCLMEINGTYRKLLVQPGAIDQCREAGRTLRHLAECLADAYTIGDDDEDDSEDESEFDNLDD